MLGWRAGGLVELLPEAGQGGPGGGGWLLLLQALLDSGVSLLTIGLELARTPSF